MRLTADVLSRVEQFLNPLKERELHLRGLKIPAIENLAVVQDQFDVIDFSDNEIKRLDNFPKMVRLTSIIANNNYIARIGKVGENAPNIKCLVLTNNKILTLGEVDNVALFKKLEHLSLLENPVALRQHYRYYVLHKIPSLKTLDYKKVTKKEKDETVAFFKSSNGKLLLASVLSEKDAQVDVSNGGGKAAVMVLSDEQKAMVRSAIENAKTREEIDIIEKHLKIGSLAFLVKEDSAQPAKEDSMEVTKEDSLEPAKEGSVEVSEPADSVAVDEEKNGSTENTEMES